MLSHLHVIGSESLGFQRPRSGWTSILFTQFSILPFSGGAAGPQCFTQISILLLNPVIVIYQGDFSTLRSFSDSYMECHHGASHRSK